jgi:hypothetical protein
VSNEGGTTGEPGRRVARVASTWVPDDRAEAVSFELGQPDATMLGAIGDVLGWSSRELTVIAVEDLLHPDDREMVADLVDRCGPASVGAFRPLEIRLLGRDLRYWWTRWSLAGAADGGLWAHGVDSLAAAPQPAPVLDLWEWALDANVISWSTQEVGVGGRDIGPPVSYDVFLASVLGEDRRDVDAGLRDSARTGERSQMTFRRRIAGRETWFHASGRRYPVGPGHPPSVGGVVKCLNPLPSAWRVPSVGCG